MKGQSRGKMSAYWLFGVRELGLADPESNLDAVVRMFLAIGDAVAARWIQLPSAILLFQMVAGDPASGAIYLYDRILQQFYMLSFEGAEDNLTTTEFNEILSEYCLLEYCFDPAMLQSGSNIHAA